MRNRAYKLIVTVAIVVLFTGGLAIAQQTTLVKTLEQKLEVKPNVSFELINKYGDIVINEWEENNVAVKIRITTYGRDDEETRKLMDRVEFDFNVSKDFVEIETVLDRQKGFLAEFFSTIGDYSKALLSKNELDIDFDVYVPSQASVTITNKFGDIVMNDLRGKVTIDLSHGNFKAGNIESVSKINVSYGNISMGEFKNGYVIIKGGELEIQKSEKANIKSSSSTIFLKETGDLMLESTSDNIRISKVKNLKGTAGFSRIDVHYLTETCDFDQQYGEMVFHNIASDFSLVKLLGRSTDYSVNVVKGASFNVEITAREDKLMLIEKPANMEKFYTDEKEKNIKIIGKYGKDASPKSMLKIDTINGRVSIDFSYPVK